MEKQSFNDLSLEEIERIYKERQEQERQDKEAKRREYEEMREETINSLFIKAVAVSEQLSKFKQHAFGEMEALFEVLVEYSKRHAEGKGNFEIKSEDDTKKAVFKQQENGEFDERSKQAEAHIQEFVQSEFKDERTKKLITKLLERKKGQLDIKLVQKLYSMEEDFSDERWKEGIRLLKESWHPTNTKTYLNLYYRDDNGRWTGVPLSLSAV